MSEIKPVSIKTAVERLREKYPNNTNSDDLLIDYVEWVEFQRAEATELRAALEALQKQNNALKLMCESKTSQLEIAGKEVARLRSLDADNKGLKECNAILTEENAALQAENAKLKEQNKKLSDSNIDVCIAINNHCREKAAQAKRIEDLESEDKISAAVIENCCNLLAEIAITIKGNPKEITRHGYRDLPELVSVLHVENELNKHRILEQSDEIEALRKQVKLHEETQSNELRKSRETVKELLDQKREVMDILLLRIDPYEIIKRAGSALSAQKGTENGTS